MKNGIKGFIVGLFVSVVGVATAFASGGIRTAEFNSNKVIFNGKQLDLSSQQLISVVKDGESSVSNYMPVRAVLEQMGYNVGWDSPTNSITISHNKIGLDDIIEDSGVTLRQMLLREGHRIDLNTIKNLESYSDLEFFSSVLEPEMLAILIVDDYITWKDEGESLFSDIWENFYIN